MVAFAMSSWYWSVRAIDVRRPDHGRSYCFVAFGPYER